MKKKYFLAAGAVIILGSILFLGYQVHEQRREEARMEEEQREIEEAYRWLHYAIGMVRYCRLSGWVIEYSVILERMSTYQTFDSLLGTEPNEHGIFHRLYLKLRMFYHRTGVHLSYESLVDYFSEEFEQDGSLRLYNNGNHPEIEAFVTWMRDGLRVGRDSEFEEYRESIDDVRVSYPSEQPMTSIMDMSPQMLDALARAEADPDYELDLTSLQEQGY